MDFPSLSRRLQRLGAAPVTLDYVGRSLREGDKPLIISTRGRTSPDLSYLETAYVLLAYVAVHPNYCPATNAAHCLDRVADLVPHKDNTRIREGSLFRAVQSYLYDIRYKFYENNPLYTLRELRFFNNVTKACISYEDGTVDWFMLAEDIENFRTDIPMPHMAVAHSTSLAQAVFFEAALPKTEGGWVADRLHR